MFDLKSGRARDERSRQDKKHLHHPYAHSESGMSVWSKATNDSVHNHDVSEEQHKFRTRRYPDVKHLSPNPCLRTKERKTKAQIMIFFFEIDHHQDVRDQ